MKGLHLSIEMVALLNRMGFTSPLKEVPALIFVFLFQDMYVDLTFSMETVKTIRNAKYFISGDLLHNGIRVNGDFVINKLLELIQD